MRSLLSICAPIGLVCALAALSACAGALDEETEYGVALDELTVEGQTFGQSVYTISHHGVVPVSPEALSMLAEWRPTRHRDTLPEGTVVGEVEPDAESSGTDDQGVDEGNNEFCFSSGTGFFDCPDPVLEGEQEEPDDGHDTDGSLPAWDDDDDDSLDD